MGKISKKIVASLSVAIVAMLIICGIAVSTISVQKTSLDETERTIVETKTEPIEFETKEINDSSIEYGKSEVRSEGSYGEKTYTYNVTYRGKKEISRALLKEEVTKQPTSRVIAKGTKIVWSCSDSTSYDKNPNNDNRCVNSKGEVRYVSDCEAIKLDPNYCPSQRGSQYYNRCGCSI